MLLSTASNNLHLAPLSLLICSGHKATYLLLFSNSSASGYKREMAGAIYLWELKGRAGCCTIATLPNVMCKNNGSVCKQDIRFPSPRLREMQKEKKRKQPVLESSHLQGASICLGQKKSGCLLICWCF